LVDVVLLRVMVLAVLLGLGLVDVVLLLQPVDVLGALKELRLLMLSSVHSYKDQKQQGSGHGNLDLCVCVCVRVCERVCVVCV
jgi:hypothetical protein